MYVIYPADEVVSLTFTSHSLPRPRPRPTLDVLAGPPLPAPSRAPSPAPPRPRALSIPKTAPPEVAARAPASPTPSLERPAKLRERTKVKLLKKLGRTEDPEFGKIVRTPAPDEFELPAPLPTPAFSRKNIFDRNFDALFEVASTPQFGANIRVTTPEPDHRTDVMADHFLSPAASAQSLLPPRPYSEPISSDPSPTPSVRTSTPSTPSLQRSSFEGHLEWNWKLRVRTNKEKHFSFKLITNSKITHDCILIYTILTLTDITANFVLPHINNHNSL